MAIVGVQCNGIQRLDRLGKGAFYAGVSLRMK